MSMLRRVLDREGLVKSNLTQSLIDCVKELQLKYAAERCGYLTNDESTNALCFCIEAIFIHGLKNPFIKSMSSALSTTGRENQIPQPSFWEFVLIFCHQEVILQINSLCHIHTDIGRCRAWLRVILNDGLLISYMQLILTDMRMLKEYYKPSAFLRDLERCDIMTSYLYGIESYDFQLACNSSLLNSWNSTPLSLVGLWTPTDSVAQGIDVAENMNAKDLQALPNLRLQSSTPPNATHFPYSIPLLEEDEALRVILSSRGSIVSSGNKSSASSSRKNSEGEVSQMSQVAGLVSSNSVIFKSSNFTKVNHVKVEGNLETETIDYATQMPSVSSSHSVISPASKESVKITPDSVNTHDTASEDSNIIVTVVENTDSQSPVSNCVPIPTAHPTSQEESSYAALFQSYNRSDNVIGTPITIGSFFDSIYFTPFEKTQHETTTSSDPALGSSLEENHSTTSPTSPTESFDFECVPRDSISSSSSDQILDLAPKLYSAIHKIPNETGLDAQNYKCKQCGRPIGMIYGAARVCGFSGNYYCSECHLNDEYVIPSRILINWDFSRFNICKQAKDFLGGIWDKPIFDLNQINPMLYKEVEECAELDVLRTQLQSMSIYLMTCKEPVMDEFSKDVWAREHLYQKIHHYSISDLLNIPNRTLSDTLTKMVVFGRNHIKSCRVCKQKGFVCEICRDNEVIFPFDLDSIFKCSACGAVYHNKCMNNNIQCPRCQRWRMNSCDEDCELDAEVTH